MNKRFDLQKLTLTDFKPGAFQQATSKLVKEQQQQKNISTPTGDSVPEGRTTLKLGKHHGVVSSHSQPVNIESASSVDSADLPSSQLSQSIENSDNAINQNSGNSQQEVSSIINSTAEVSSSVSAETAISKNDNVIPVTPLLEESAVAEIFIPPSGEQAILYGASDSKSQTERVAALNVKAVRANKPKPPSNDPESLVAFNTRQPKWLKDSFFKACSDKGATPSLIIRNLMKSYCGLCLIFVVVSSAFSNNIKDTTFSTDQLLSYFYSKTFNAKSLVPDLKSSVGVRHSLWQTGAQDSTDYIYADRSNTRLEARIDIPILDVGYLKDRSKDKDELRAFIMKSLSKVLAAQKSVNVLESRLNALKSRLEFLRNQITLKLVNKSDLFPVEDQFYNVQSQLYEAQSTLEQRIIDLAIIAGNDWLDAYRLIVKWDGKLFDQVNK